MQEKYATLLDNLSQVFRSRDRATEILKWLIMQDAIKDISGKELSDDSFTLDLNPHLTVNYCIEHVKKAVETEGLTCEKYDVALLWLTRELIDKTHYATS